MLCSKCLTLIAKSLIFSNADGKLYFSKYLLTVTMSFYLFSQFKVNARFLSNTLDCWGDLVLNGWIRILRFILPLQVPQFCIFSSYLLRLWSGRHLQMLPLHLFPTAPIAPPPHPDAETIIPCKISQHLHELDPDNYGN